MDGSPFIRGHRCRRRWWFIEITAQFLCDLIVCVRRLNEDWITRNSIQLMLSWLTDWHTQKWRTCESIPNKRKEWHRTCVCVSVYVPACLSVCLSTYVRTSDCDCVWFRCQYRFDTVFISFPAKKKVTVIQFDQHNSTNRFSAFNNSISIIDVSSFFFVS